jgi:hypothetical protein
LARKVTYTVYVRTPRGDIHAMARHLTRTAAERLVTNKRRIAKQRVPSGNVYTMVGH